MNSYHSLRVTEQVPAAHDRTSSKFGRTLAARLAIVALLPAMAVAGCTIPNVAGGGSAAPAVAPIELTYADSATLALQSPVIVDVNVARARALEAERSPGLAPGYRRYYIEAGVNTLLRGEGGLPAQIDFLADWPLSAGEPRLQGNRFLAFARPVAGRPSTIQLVRPDSLIRWTPSNDAVTRAATREAVAINAPPAIANVGQAFHFPGQVDGEGETQIFFETESSEPVSLRIVSAPGEPRRWGFSLGEVVAAELTPPPANSLLWYRLACGGLPERLPSSSIASGSDDAKIRADYQFVRDDLGPCTRNLR